MSFPQTAHQHQAIQLGGAAFNHSPHSDSEAEYDRLRKLARQERDKRSHCWDKSHEARQRGDDATADELSEEGKRHDAMMEQYNQQASDYIFRENNAIGRVDSDTIDLHGQFVEEARNILEARIRYAQQQGQTHLHVASMAKSFLQEPRVTACALESSSRPSNSSVHRIVGKGNHSVNHIQKIKPEVEEICRELGLQFATEENQGRIYVNLQGGPAVMPALSGGRHHGGHQQHHPHGQQQAGYQGPPPQGPQYFGGGGPGYQQQQGGGQDEVQEAVKKILPRILRKMEEKGCCMVM